MQRFARCLISVIGAACLAARASAQKQKDPGDDIQHIREELGINAFTAPSIGVLFEELHALQPIPFDKAWRDLSEGPPADRPRLALYAGQVIADGFLVVAAEKQSRIEPIARLLLKSARGLGVGEHVTRHSKSFLELAARGRWAEVKQELVRAQADVEAGMMALKDEEIAHLVSLGGWLRGLEITSSVILEDFHPEKARRLIQPAISDYFSERVATLNPRFKATPLGTTIQKNFGAIRQLTTKTDNASLSAADVTQIRDLAREINKAIAAPQQ